MDKKWFTLRVYSGQENKVKAHLENEIKFKNLEDRFGRIIVPSESVLEMRDGKKRLKILFSIFCFSFINLTFFKN